MKIIKNIFLGCLAAMVLSSCEKGLDPITPLSPGNDIEDPTLTITFPVAGKPVNLMEGDSIVTFKFIAVDDIELGSIKIDIDETEIANITSFKDYRRAVVDYAYAGLEDGNHKLTVTATDLVGKSVSKFVNFRKTTLPPYEPLEGEVLYIPFEGSYLDWINGVEASKTGSPTFAPGKLNDGYVGATDSYLTLSSAGITSPQFSVTFWIKVNSTPDRAGILSLSPPGDSRNSGLRIFREGTIDEQKIGVNFGIGASEVWMNPIYTFAPDGSWLHVALTIADDKAVAYINGEMVMENIKETPAPIDWAGVTSLTIGSGQPNFVYWEHFSDLSMYDEIHFFNRAITAEEVQALYNVE